MTTMKERLLGTAVAAVAIAIGLTARYVREGAGRDAPA